MKVLLDCTGLSIGGAIQVGLAVLKNASEFSSIEWHVIASEEISRQFPKNMRDGFKSFSHLTSSSLYHKFQFRSIIPRIEKAINPDVVFSVFWPSHWKSQAPHIQGFALPTIIYPEIIITTGRLDINLSNRLKDVYRRRLIQQADYLIVETEIVKHRLNKYLKFPTHNIFIVRNTYSPQFKESLSRLPSKAPTKIFTILIPSVYYPHKNLEIIPSVAQCLHNIVNQKVQFIFTLAYDDLGWKSIMNVAKRLNVSSLIKTLGRVPHHEIAHAYRTSDIVFLPTLLECSTAVYPETFLAEIPLVTSDLDFAHGLCGDAAAYINPFNPTNAAETIARLMTDRAMGLELAKRGRVVLAERYPSPEEKWWNQLSCIYEVADMQNLRK